MKKFDHCVWISPTLINFYLYVYAYHRDQSYEMLPIYITSNGVNLKWDVTWENLPAPNEYSNSPALVRMKKLRILGYPKCAQWRLRSDCPNAQSDLNLRLAHIYLKVRFLTQWLNLFTTQQTKSNILNFTFRLTWHCLEEPSVRDVLFHHHPHHIHVPPSP